MHVLHFIRFFEEFTFRSDRRLSGSVYVNPNMARTISDARSNITGCYLVCFQNEFLARYVPIETQVLPYRHYARNLDDQDSLTRLPC